MATRTIPNRPARQVCPLCATDELQYEPLGDHLWLLRCPTCHDDEGTSWSWQCDLKAQVEIPNSLMAELGLFEDLPRCLHAGDPWVEHGVVEDRYRRLNPTAYDELLERYSHTALGPKRYTTSAFIASALGRLFQTREVVLLSGREATGFWSYNSQVGYWALPPAPPEDKVLMWAEYAPTVGIDPATWPIPLVCDPD